MTVGKTRQKEGREDLCGALGGVRVWRGGGEEAQEGERMASRASWGRMRKWRLASGRWRKPR